MAELTNGNTSSISHRYDSNPSIATYRVTCPNSKTPSIPGTFLIKMENLLTQQLVKLLIKLYGKLMPNSEIAHSNFPEAQSIISGFNNS